MFELRNHIQISLIEFSLEIRTPIHFSSNETEILQYLDFLQVGCISGQQGSCTNRLYGYTYTAHALQQAYEEFEQYSNPESLKQVYLFNDGTPYYSSNPQRPENCCDYYTPGTACSHSDDECYYAIGSYHAGKLKDDFGAMLVPIYISSINKEEIFEMFLNASTYDCLFMDVESGYTSENMDKIKSVIVEVAGKEDYVSIEFASPSYLCNEEIDTQEYEVLINGELQFNISSDRSWVTNYRSCSQQDIKYRITELDSGLTSKTIIVPSSDIVGNSFSLSFTANKNSRYQIEVSLDGISFSFVNSIIVNSIDCTIDEINDPVTCDFDTKSDIVFLVDSSSSLGYEEFLNFRQVLVDQIKKFCISDDFVRVSIIQYTTENLEKKIEIVLPLTGDITEAITEAKYISKIGNGNSPLHLGLKEAYEQLKNQEEDRKKYVIIYGSSISDSCQGLLMDTECGFLSEIENTCRTSYLSELESSGNKTNYWEFMNDHHCCGCDSHWIEILKEIDAEIYAITIGENIDQLYFSQRIASNETYHYHVDSMDSNSFSSIINEVSNSINYNEEIISASNQIYVGFFTFSLILFFLSL